MASQTRGFYFEGYMMNLFHSVLYKYATSGTMADLSNRYPVKAEDIKTVRDLYNAVWVMFKGNISKLFEFLVVGAVVLMLCAGFLSWTYFSIVVYPFIDQTGIDDHILAWLYYVLVCLYLSYRFETVERIGRLVLSTSGTIFGWLFGNIIQRVDRIMDRELDVDTKDPE